MDKLEIERKLKEMPISEKMANKAAAYDDERKLAYIDGALDALERGFLLGQLSEPDLRKKHYEETKASLEALKKK